MIKKSLTVAGRELVIETGMLAKQASGSVVIKYGDTVALVTATANKDEGEDRGFFPLMVEYREKYYASGRIPGGFFKREARPSEKEIIASRLTDRPLRPLFPDGFNAETQVMITLLSYDGENHGDILGTIGASVALLISDIPWNGPVAAVRVGRIDGDFVTNPTVEQLEVSDMEIIISGTSDSIVMVEGESDFISEEDFLSSIQYGHEVIKDIIKLQEELADECGLPKRSIVEKEVNLELHKKIDSIIEGKISGFNKPKDKHSRYEDIRLFINDVVQGLIDEYPDDSRQIKSYIDQKISEDLRSQTLHKGLRADGRDTKTVRDIDILTSLLPRAHGSAVFTRGETQALATLTLGNKKDEQMIDNIEGLSYKKYMLHYNFPPYSVGEARMRFSLSRREVGHGNLAERAVGKVLPDFDDFPYTIRMVSEVLESNGSSSMATVCSSVLALMDGGVPIKAPVAGVAMGLIMEDKDNYAILTDILGTEDHLGDMDFKVAGTKDGITAIQMDLKIDGLPIDIMTKALQQAKEARLHILSKMEEALPKHRSNLSEYAPKVYQGMIPIDRIGEFIGPGGKNIKALCEEYECEINIEDSGQCIIMGVDAGKMEKALDVVNSYSLVPEVGDIFDAEVVKTLDFGAFVKVAPGKEGLVHISEIALERVNKVEDHLKVGQKVKVKLVKIDDQGRAGYSIKALLKKEQNA